MNTKKIIEEIKKQYPGKNIAPNREKDPTEILVEVEPATNHPEYSIAISVVDKTEVHLHHKTAEIYQVIKGTLTLVKNGRSTVLKEGEVDIIKPGEAHYAIGTETWVRVYSEPGWTAQDHIAMSGEASRPILSFRQERLLVSDFDACLEFYKTVLGLEPGYTDKDHKYAELKTGDTVIALFHEKSMLDALGLSVNKAKAAQSSLLVFSVEDLDRAYNFIVKEKKTPLIKEITTYEAWGVKAFHISDPAGTFIEINQELTPRN